jgi:hypothetical protein
MRDLIFVTIVTLSGCVRNPPPVAESPEDDRSIVFPQFFAHEAIELGTPGKTYELDGEMLRALTIAANDFAPAGGHATQCRGKQEANLYRAIRQGGVIFIYVYEDEKYCGHSYPSLDSGAKYAIGADGRILRRILDGQPTGLVDSAPSDGGDIGDLAEPGVLPGFDDPGDAPESTSSRRLEDAGLLAPSPDAGK